MKGSGGAVDKDYRVVIVGAGFSGMAMAFELMAAGVGPFVILEAADELGGTWRDNTYPGCACDIPSHLYSLRRFPSADWSRAFSGQAEILEYMKRIGRQQGLYQHIRFNFEVTEARFDEASGAWTVVGQDGEQVIGQSLVLGIGGLNIPNVPEIPGLERFAGPRFHTTTWDHSVDLAGKRVGVIGTGASAVQVVPAVAEEVAKLGLYQRTPPWILPRRDKAFSALRKRLYARVPGLRWIHRLGLYWARELGATFFLRNPKRGYIPELLARGQIRRQIKDPELRDKVTPRYRLGCKRALVSDDYYPALTRENVDLLTCGIEEVTEGGILGKDGVERPYDVLVMATGFKVLAALTRFKAYGRDGRELNEAWRDFAEAYYGITVTGFPNLFMLLGPNTALGHNSVVLMIEAQARYARLCIERLAQDKRRSIEVLPEVQRSFNARIQDRMAGTVWASGCQSWYINPSGRNDTIWPGYVWQYQWRTRHPDFRAFRFEDAPAPVPSEA